MSLRFYIEPPIETGGICPLTILSYFSYTETTYEECDFVISTMIPWGCTDATVIQSVMDSYRSSIPRVIVFLLSDYNEEIDVPPQVLYFRSGMYRSKQKPNEYLLPYVWVQSELKGEVPFVPLEKKGNRPLIGFCGSIVSDPCRLIHINEVKKAPQIKTNFIIRTEYWAGKQGDRSVVDDFIKNIQTTYGTLCSRGTGNFSARFYQVLYLGRIPIVVNTDMVLPFEDRINWKEIIVLCQSEKELVRDTIEWWKIDMGRAQIRAKEIYETYLEPKKWCERIANDIFLPLIRSF
jgi:hypothetical protein